MKKITLLIVSCIATSVMIITAQSNRTITSAADPATAIATATSEEGEADAEARMKWEKQRLADPATGKIPEFIHGKEMAFAATLPKDAQLMNAKFSSTLTWDFRGPWNVGGRTRAFAIDVTNENIMLAGGVSGGMWRSTDGGLTWARCSSVNAHPDVIAIAQDTRAGHTNTWYYLSGEAYGTSSSGGAAFLSNTRSVCIR